MTELPPPDRLLKSRDRKPVRYLPAWGWACAYCTPGGGEGAGTTVDWITGPNNEQYGRCRVCGQKWQLALPFEHLPELLDD